MGGRQICVIFSTLMLVVLLIAPSSASTGIEEGDKQVSGDTAWWHISLFGDDQLSNCYSILYGDGESADYGEQSNSGDILNINFTCSMDPVLDRDLILIEGDDIDARFKIELDGQWTNGQDDCNDDCENLNISLIKGDYTVAIKEFDNLDQGTNVIRWGIPIYDDLVYWNGSSDNIAIQFTMKIKPIEGGGFSADRDAVFGLYYSPTENDGPVYSDDDHTEIVFPVPCTNCGGGGLEDLPGFTWIISIGGLAMAAILIQNSSRMSESILKYEIIEYG